MRPLLARRYWAPCRLAAAGLLWAVTLAACAPAPRVENLVWRKDGGSPKQEETDYSECIARAERVVERQYYWKKDILQKRIEAHSRWAADNRYKHMKELTALEKEEAERADQLADQCMIGRGYRKVPPSMVGGR